MGVVFKLESFLDKHKITKNALAREAKVRPNTIYEICNGEAKRIELKTFNEIMATLIRLTGEKVPLSDIIDYIPDSNDKTANQ
ncbi:helix-turn-helix domain-containing protein [Paenibacillus thailandensis]|uniref:Helix-turn-helix domain-containing protein n=1 Tax=Paenibacillus thailandensis TaxID=393250 RepID=A0ABW5R126_9BACL